MATLGDLKTRIIAETNRDDMGSGGALEDGLALCISSAIEFHASEQFWFNRGSGSGTTTQDDATLDLPAGVRFPSLVAYNGRELRKVPLEALEYRTEAGPPSKWAENEGQVQLWPIPDAAYTIYLYGVADTGAPASDGDSNIWTEEAYDLIAAETRFRLYRDYLRDVEGATLARDARDEALGVLRRETRRRGGVKLSTDVPPAHDSFNIVTGD